MDMHCSFDSNITRVGAEIMERCSLVERKGQDHWHGTLESRMEFGVIVWSNSMSQVKICQGILCNISISTWGKAEDME